MATAQDLQALINQMPPLIDAVAARIPAPGTVINAADSDALKMNLQAVVDKLTAIANPPTPPASA